MSIASKAIKGAAKILGKGKKPKQPEKQQVVIENAEVFCYPKGLRNKDIKVPEIIHIVKDSKAGEVKAGKKPESKKQVEIKPFVVESDEELDGKPGSKGTFKESRKDGGIKTKEGESWDKERMRAALMDTDPEKLPMITVTRKSEFAGLVAATSFNDVAVLGEKRDLRTQSFTSIYIRNRDIRAPSAFPEEGDSRKEIMKQLEYAITEENATRDSLKYGSGGG